MMDDLPKIDDVAKFLGVSHSEIYALVAKKKIPHVKLTGKLLRFRWPDIMTWVENCAVYPSSAVPSIRARKNGVRKGSRGAETRIEQIINRAKREVLNK